MTDYQIVANTCRRLVGEQYPSAKRLYKRIIDLAALYYPEHEFKNADRSVDCAIQRLRPDCDRYDDLYSREVGYVLVRTKSTSGGTWLVAHCPIEE